MTTARAQRRRDEQLDHERALVAMRDAVIATVGGSRGRQHRFGSAAIEDAVDEALAQMVRRDAHHGDLEHAKATWIRWAQRRLIDDGRSAETRHRAPVAIDTTSDAVGPGIVDVDVSELSARCMADQRAVQRAARRPAALGGGVLRRDRCGQRTASARPVQGPGLVTVQDQQDRSSRPGQDGRVRRAPRKRCRLRGKARAARRVHRRNRRPPTHGCAADRSRARRVRAAAFSYGRVRGLPGRVSRPAPSPRVARRDPHIPAGCARGCMARPRREARRCRRPAGAWRRGRRDRWHRRRNDRRQDHGHRLRRSALRCWRHRRVGRCAPATSAGRPSATQDDQGCPDTTSGTRVADNTYRTRSRAARHPAARSTAATTACREAPSACGGGSDELPDIDVAQQCCGDHHAELVACDTR